MRCGAAGLQCGVGLDRDFRHCHAAGGAGLQLICTELHHTSPAGTAKQQVERLTMVPKQAMITDVYFNVIDRYVHLNRPCFSWLIFIDVYTAMIDFS